MDARTLKALRQSIEKWERNAVAQTPDDFATGIADCALCGLFWGGHCYGCPVKAKTGQTHCCGTPYNAARAAKNDWFARPADPDLRDAAHTAARVEEEFLRSLLPEGGIGDGPQERLEPNGHGPERSPDPAME